MCQCGLAATARANDGCLLSCSDFELIDSIQRENGITILWRLTSSRYAGEFLGQLTLQSGESGMEISAVSVN